MSARAEAVYRRTYSRPKPDGSRETFPETIDRVIEHQRWLWERAKGSFLTLEQEFELAELRQLFMSRRGLPSGRTLWLGGTEIARRREACQFNCAYLRISTVCDVVDAFWLLLQGCGVGFRAVPGNLSGFSCHIPEVKFIRSTRTEKGGRETNVETYEDGVWTLSVGDSAEAWAKVVGKLLAGKHSRCHRLVIDLSNIRPAGTVLAGYGWISGGDHDFYLALKQIVGVLNGNCDELLDQLAIQDIINLLGTVLSSRRSAQISLHCYGIPGWEEFATCKADLQDVPWRTQSNNSLLFYSKPSKEEITRILDLMLASGGSEPGMINAIAALIRAPWFSGVNPCVEILLCDKGFCNLVEYNIAATTDLQQIIHDLWLLSRANYRQTCVNLNDGVLQNTWHQNNQFLRLCGVSLTGIAGSEVWNRPEDLEIFREVVTRSCDSMADELHLPHAKNKTCVKPSGTLSKLMDSPGEGMHAPLGAYIFNKINFGNDDPLLVKLIEAGYDTMPNPYSPSGTLVTFPVNPGGPLYNTESAISQLERYRFLMKYWCDQNVSCTISYSPDELSGIAEWLHAHWDDYVGVSFILRTDPTKKAADLGYQYLPQEIVSSREYAEYVNRLRPVSYETIHSTSELMDDCVGGQCPIR